MSNNLVLSVDGEGFHSYSSGDCVETDAIADCNGLINGYTSKFVHKTGKTFIVKI